MNILFPYFYCTYCDTNFIKKYVDKHILTKKKGSYSVVNVDEPQPDSKNLTTTPILYCTCSFFLRFAYGFVIEQNYYEHVNFQCSKSHLNGIYLTNETKILLRERIQKNEKQAEYITISYGKNGDEKIEIEVKTSQYLKYNYIGSNILYVFGITVVDNKIFY